MNSLTNFSNLSSLIRRNYLALIQGAAIIAGLTLLLYNETTYLIIDSTNFSIPASIFINVLSLAFCWLCISYLISKFTLYKVLGLVTILVIAAVAERYANIEHNPVTIPFLILFWMGVAYFILPQFFKKYQFAILSVYGLVIFYYFFNFITTPDYGLDQRLSFSRFVLLPIPVFAVLWGYEQWRWLKILKADKAKAELSLLKNQINPHFFFNTLNNLYGLAIEKSDQTPTMILKLSDIMRYTIYDSKADYVPLKNEITYLKDYIDLHKIRYQRKVDISFHLNLKHTHEIAPLLLVIPLENAFKHGVESQAGNAFIKLEVSTTVSSISFNISNNYEATMMRSQGIGLDNLKKRLALIYPDKHHLEISKTADIYTLSLKIELDEISNH